MTHLPFSFCTSGTKMHRRQLRHAPAAWADGSADCLTFFVLGRGLEELLCWSAPFSVSLSTYLGCAGGCAGQTWRNPHAKEFGCRCITFTSTCRIGRPRIPP